MKKFTSGTIVLLSAAAFLMAPAAAKAQGYSGLIAPQSGYTAPKAAPVDNNPVSTSPVVTAPPAAGFAGMLAPPAASTPGSPPPATGLYSFIRNDGPQTADQKRAGGQESARAEAEARSKKLADYKAAERKRLEDGLKKQQGQLNKAAEEQMEKDKLLEQQKQLQQQGAATTP